MDLNDYCKPSSLESHVQLRPFMAVNINDSTDLRGLEEVAMETITPFMALLSRKALERGDPEILLAITEVVRRRTPLIRVGLDHVKSVSMLSKYSFAYHAIDLVMIDGSELSLEDNVSLVKAARKILPDHILIEGEVGLIGVDDASSRPTDGAELRRFLLEADVDYVAVSVGNRHEGQTKPRLNLARLSELQQIVVEHGRGQTTLHGCDYVDESDLHVALRLGVAKLNIGPELRVIYYDALRGASSMASDPRDMFDVARQQWALYLKEKWRRVTSDDTRITY